MHDGWIVELAICRPRAALSALNCFVHHLAAQPKSLGVIAWLPHCCSLAAFVKDMLVQGLA
jgi:hypothetical protein